MASRALLRRPAPGAIPTYMERTWASRGTTEEERVCARFLASVTDTAGWALSGGDGDWTPKVQLFVAATQLMRGIDLSTEAIFAALRQKVRERAERGHFTLFDYGCGSGNGGGGSELCLPVAEDVLPVSVDGALREFAVRNAFLGEDDGELRTHGLGVSSGLHTVLDPIMFAAVRSRTKSLDEGHVVDGSRPWDSMGRGSVGNTGKVFQAADRHYDDVDFGGYGGTIWPRFQRLPSQVRIQEGHARITSYVNGLHPLESAMCGTFEEMIDYILPMWQRCIDATFRRRAAVLDPKDDNKFTYMADTPLPRPEGTDLMRPGAELQVIIQVEMTDKDDATSRIDPGAPSSTGRSYIPSSWWRSVGAAHEHVCAVAIYCYDMDPDADVHIHLRQPIDYEYLSDLPARHARDPQHAAELRRSVLSNLDVSTWEDSLVGFGSLTDDGEQEQGHHHHNHHHEDENTMAPGASFLGSIRLRQGRLVVIPASLVYRIHFQGRTERSGIVFMSLVDPSRPILSTARVPPQSRDWLLPKIRECGWLARLPEELWQQICSYLQWAWWETDDEQEPVDGWEVRRRRDGGRFERDRELVPLLLVQDEAMYQLKEGTGSEED